jgi:hypothetical protein
MKIGRLSIRELAIHICDYLHKNGIDVVLSGGACVAIYTRNRYLSYDLDFVLTSYQPRSKIKRALWPLRFVAAGRLFKHKDTEYLIDLPSPPPSVGDKPIKKISEIKNGKKVLKLLSPTDCVKDRLAAYYHWEDRQSLEQALGVARDKRISIAEIKGWSIKEGREDKFKIFLRAHKLNKK